MCPRLSHKQLPLHIYTDDDDDDDVDVEAVDTVSV